jgi:hypothetical protein
MLAERVCRGDEWEIPGLLPEDTYSSIWFVVILPSRAASFDHRGRSRTLYSVGERWWKPPLLVMQKSVLADSISVFGTADLRNSTEVLLPPRYDLNVRLTIFCGLA